MNVKHTPPPWKVEGHDIVSINPDKHIAAIIRHNPGTTIDEQIANAAFIVRAVNSHEELLSVMTSVRDLLPTVYNESRFKQFKERIEDRLLKAIAKAEGK